MMVEQSGGLLASPEPSTLTSLSLCKGHLNQLMRCIFYAVPTTKDALAVDGKMNLDKIRSKDALFGKAVEEGIEWLELHWKVGKKWPKFIEMVVAEGNTGAQLQRVEHELQVLLRIHNALLKMIREDNVDKDKLLRSVVRSKPPCKDYVHILLKFVELCGGGENGQFLQELCRFQKMHCNTKVVLKADFWQAVYSLEFGAGTPCILFRIALCKAALQCPDQYVKNGTAKWITEANVKMCGSDNMKTKIRDAEGVLSACRQIAKETMEHADVAVGDKDLMKLFGRLDVRMALMILGKVKIYSKPEQIGQAFFDELLDMVDLDPATRQKLKDASPWSSSEEDVKEESDVATNAQQDTTMVEFNADGSLKDGTAMLARKGYSVNQWVVEKNIKVRHRFALLALMGQQKRSAW